MKKVKEHLKYFLSGLEVIIYLLISAGLLIGFHILLEAYPRTTKITFALASIYIVGRLRHYFTHHDINF